MPARRELAARVEDTMNLAMRVVLHHPEFQDLEAAWRSVDFLLRRLELGSDLQLHLIDLSKQELLDDLIRGGGPAIDRTLPAAGGGSRRRRRRGSLGRHRRTLHVRRGAGRDPRARSHGPAGARGGCALPLFAQPALHGHRVVRRAARFRRLAVTPIGTDAEQEWNTLRSAPEASWIGAALPRFLLRYPYGKDSNSWMRSRSKR